LPTDLPNLSRPAELAVIGAGQIGFRHLQAMGRLSFPARTWVVDAVKSAAESACTRAALGTAEVARAATYGELPPSLAVAIVATTADCRLAALEQLLGATKVHHVILEKVLFQTDADFHRAENLLAGFGTTAWVNCGRRLYPIYQHIRGELARRSEPMLLNVTGSNLRLGTNLIHLVDLFAYLTGSVEMTVDAAGIVDPPRPGKRAGCIEFDGLVQMRTPRGDVACVQSLGAPGLSRHATVRCGDATWLLDEMSGALAVQEVGVFHFESVAIPLQSEMSHRFVEQLVLQSTTRLTPFSDSVALHRQMFAGLDAALSPRWPQWASGGARPIT